MNNFLNIAFIGAGNITWHLAPALENSGHKVGIVFNRNRKNAEVIINRLYNARYKQNLDFSSDLLDIVIIAVHDSAISDIASEIILPENCLLLHTSGSQPVDLLEKSAASIYGVLYPLQTFTINTRIDFREVPIFVEGNTESAINRIASLAKDLSNNVHILNSVQRRALHLSAVFASNFSNHMITIAHKIIKEYDLDINHLRPVMEQMLKKAFETGPEAGQTGPARRADLETLDRHMEMLEGQEELMEIYSILSKHIMDTYR